MSLPTPATDRFLQGWNPNDSAPQMLVRVELTIPTALTLYWCLAPIAGISPLVVNPGGFSWQPVIIDGDPIHAPGGLLEPGPSLAVTGFRIANFRLIPQASGTAADLFSDYVVRGSPVTMWLWHAGLSDFATDALQVFRGVIQSASVLPETIDFRCQQRKDESVTVPPNKIDRSNEPNAPEASLGLRKPLVYGQFINDGMDEPWLEPYPGITDPFSKLAQEDVGAGGLVIPGILVDSGVGGADGKVIFADHPLKLIGNTVGEPNVKVAAGSALASLNGTAIASALLSDNSGVYLKDEENLAYIGIPCIDVRVTGTFPNLALNPRAALDPWDETTYPIIKSDGGFTRLSLVVGSVGSPGQMVSAELVIGYRTSHKTTPALARYQRPSSSGADPADLTLSAHGAGPVAVGEPVIQRITLITGDIYSDPNNVYAAGTVSSDWNTGAGDLLVFLNPATAGHWIHPFFIGIVVKYKPSQSLVAGEIATSVPLTLKGLQRIMRRPPGTAVILDRNGLRIQTAPSIYEAQGQFFANCHGREDTTGDYTGVVGDLVERPMDVIQHLLEVYGGEDPDSIETAINRFGSFSRARPRNTSVEGNPIALGVHVGAETQLHPLLSRIAQQAPGWLYLSRFDDRWKFVPWDRRAPVADFPRTLEAADILEGGFAADALSETLIVNDASVGYAYDFFRNRSIHSASVGPEASSGGFASRGKRDQLLKIEVSGAGQNNKLDLVRSAVTYAATLNGATYTPAQMMVELKRALTALAIGGAQWNAGWGGTVIAGHNDKVDFIVSGTTYAATVAPGGWTVGEMAYQMQLAMAALAGAAADIRVGLGMYVLAGVNDALDFNDPITKRVTIPPGYYRDGAHLARTVQDLLNSQSSNWTCTYNTGTQKFTIARSSGTANLLWLSGTSKATNCAALLGYSHVADDTGAASYVSDYARNPRRVHVQGILSVTLKTNSGANKATSIAVSAGWDQTTDPVGLNNESTYAVQDETFALSEITAFSLPWQSGANTALSVAHVIGFKVASDDAALTRHMADRRRSDRETRCKTSRDRYGPKETENVVAVDVRTTEAALNLRDTVVDLLSEGPIPLKIKTHKLPDLERGRILAVGDLSSLVTKPPRYGAGAWAGKLFRAVEVAQHWGRSWHQEIVLMEEQSPLGSVSSTEPDDVVVPAPFFVAWNDNRNGSTSQTYVQKITIDGAAAWTANGVIVSAGTSSEYFTPRSAVLGLPDDGCVVLYMENVSGTTKLRAQRFDKEGTKLWGSTGVEVSTSINSTQGYSPRIVSDDLGGFYFGWRSGVVDGFHVRRCASDGTFPWVEVLLGDNTGSNDFSNGSSFELIPDGANGVYGIWYRGTSGDGIMGQRVAPAGSLMWNVNGVNMGLTGQHGTIAFTPPRVSGFVYGGALYIAISASSFTFTVSFQIRRIDPADGSTGWTTSNLEPGATRIPIHTMQTFATAAGIYGIWWDDTGANGNGRIVLVDDAGVQVWANPITFATRPMATFDSEVPKQMVVASGLGVIIIYHEPVCEDETLKAVLVDEEGNVVWGPVDVSDPTGDIEFTSACSDGEGGAVIAYDASVSVNDKLYAIHLKADGTTEWGAPGFLVSGSLTDARKPAWVSKAA